MKNGMNLIWCFTLLAFIILGCNNNKVNENITNSKADENSFGSIKKEQNQNTLSEQKKVINPYESGGLGLSKIEWENLFGSPKENDSLNPIYYSYEKGKYAVQFAPIENGNVRHIEFHWGDKSAVSISDARTISKNYIPKDAKFKKTYIAKSESIVDLYESESLKNRFSKEYFDEKQGEFIIIYRNQTGKTTSFIVATGNNP